MKIPIPKFRSTNRLLSLCLCDRLVVGQEKPIMTTPMANSGLIDIIIDSGASLFVSAVGIPPMWAIDKLHDAGILVMNMIGSQDMYKSV